MTNYLRNEMANVLLKKSIQRVSFLSQSVIDSEHFYDPIDLLADAVRIYASTPFNGAHALTVQITALPFCIPSYRDQIFYCVDASYAKCCHEIEKEDFVLFLYTLAEELYLQYMSHHSWNFRTQHSWRQIQVPEQVRQTHSSCLERSSLLLRHLITEDGFQNLTEQHPVRNQDDGSIDQYAICFQDETKSKLSLHQDFISSATSPPCPCSTSKQIQNEYAAVTMSYSGGTPKVQLKNENAILELADEFLRNLSSTSVASAATELGTESSNYHRIRLMNRYAETKKRLAIWQICGNLNLDVQLKTELPELRIQTLILEYMPDLW
ncbi:hypothetical protein HBI93_155510 [Parastagonospora nodorum]|nr:hypothetical protein HBH67_122040 [Parastagonospora nodorum]KAH4788201.1 hypothetical protein HBH62_053830 [Parastagonospora nodorum]KAH5825072.1 hypothetical protein HBI93_155510 [Parastagonospora nodorum]KAH6211145.1 hypothetical protein HBI43_160230 [Parastagonospora nodorum]